MSRENAHHHILGQPDESARLLPDVEHEGSPASFRASGITPLPKAQLGALVVARMVDPIAYTQIFPYINQLLVDLHIAVPEQVGFYSGFIESAYSLAQVFSVYQWGRLSDIIGRRPVLIFSLVGIAMATIGFGLSTSLATITTSRFLGGLVAGNIAVLHSVLVEITDDTNQNIAVPIYSLSWSTGTIIGPFIGGTFANAATQYPKYFSWPIFVKHPYLPPCIISAICALVGVGLGYLLIEETLPSKRRDYPKGVGGNNSPSGPDGDPGSADTRPGGAKALLAIPAIRALTLSGLVLSFLASAFDVVFTLFCYTPIDAGGLGLHPSTIGNFLAFAGTLAVLLRLIAMPYILRRFDHTVIYNTCMYFWPITFACLPLFNAFARARPPLHPEMPLVAGISTATGNGNGVQIETGVKSVDVGMWAGLALVLALSKVAAMPFSIMMLLIKRHAPQSGASVPSYTSGTGTGTGAGAGAKNGSGGRTATGTGTSSGTVTATRAGSGSALGQSNGLVQFAMCIGRTVGPIVVSLLFTALNGSARVRQWGLGWTWSAFMTCVAVMGARLTREIL